MAMHLLLGVLFIFILSKFDHSKGDLNEQFRSAQLEKHDGITNIFKRSMEHFSTRLRRQSGMEQRYSRSARADAVAAEAEKGENKEYMVAGLRRRKRWMKKKCPKHGHAESVARGAVVKTRTRHFDVANYVQKEGQGFGETEHQQNKDDGTKNYETTTSRGSIGIPRAFPNNFGVSMPKK